MYDWKERSHVSQQVWICTRCIVRGAAEQLCATLGTKLAQSRETPLAAAASRHQAANYRSLTSVALFLLVLWWNPEIDGCLDGARPDPPWGFRKVSRTGITGSALPATRWWQNTHLPTTTQSCPTCWRYKTKKAKLENNTSFPTSITELKPLQQSLSSFD